MQHFLFVLSNKDTPKTQTFIQCNAPLVIHAGMKKFALQKKKPHNLKTIDAMEIILDILYFKFPYHNNVIRVLLKKLI